MEVSKKLVNVVKRSVFPYSVVVMRNIEVADAEHMATVYVAHDPLGTSSACLILYTESVLAPEAEGTMFEDAKIALLNAGFSEQAAADPEIERIVRGRGQTAYYYNSVLLLAELKAAIKNANIVLEFDAI